MIERRPVFPHVIELNYQARERIGCNVYLVYDDDQWLLIDVGYEDTVDEIVDLVRALDFPLSRCKTIVATHADADHVQGLAKAKNLIKTTATGHPLAVEPLKTGDKVMTFSETSAQGIHMEFPSVELEILVDEGDRIEVGSLQLEVWHTPGHTNNMISLRMGDLLFSADNIYRDGGVGVIDAHHGSHIPDFIKSLERIRDSDVKWLLPNHGPIFRKDDALLDSTIERLTRYLHMPDFGTCAIDWPLMQDWEKELAEGQLPLDE